MVLPVIPVRDQDAVSIDALQTHNKERVPILKCNFRGTEDFILLSVGCLSHCRQKSPAPDGDVYTVHFCGCFSLCSLCLPFKVDPFFLKELICLAGAYTLAFALLSFAVNKQLMEFQKSENLQPFLIGFWIV